MELLSYLLDLCQGIADSKVCNVNVSILQSSHTYVLEARGNIFHVGIVYAVCGCAIYTVEIIKVNNNSHPLIVILCPIVLVGISVRNGFSFVISVFRCELKCKDTHVVSSYSEHEIVTRSARNGNEIGDISTARHGNGSALMIWPISGKVESLIDILFLNVCVSVS